jgi:hypothetical protein
MITQCDLKRTLPINDPAKLYMAQPFDEGKPQPLSKKKWKREFRIQNTEYRIQK